MGAGWYRPAPDNMGGFSAVCWMFGRRLQSRLGVPVGLIENQVGGTAVLCSNHVNGNTVHGASTWGLERRFPWKYALDLRLGADVPRERHDRP